MASIETTRQGNPPSLNRAQREAVEHFEGPLLVLAGAGSGKTRVLTARIANLIRKHGVNPAEILAVTFTNKAAGEMKERISKLIGHATPSMWIGTFHALGARMLRLNAPAVNRTSNFTIYDPDDTSSLIKQMIEAQRMDVGDLNARAIHSAISDAKNRMISPSEYESLARDKFSRVVAPLYTGLEAALRANNAVTFDDLLTLPLELLTEHESVRNHYQHKFRFILVDEYQDTNKVQYRFIALLGARHRNVCVVGDDDQSIYGWRGADVRNILDFEKGFPGARVVRLEENYRSTPGILEVANAIIKENPERRGKTLRPTLPPGEAVTLTPALDERDEAEWIADEIASRRSREARMLRDFAVIYRTNAQSRILEEVFRRRSIPYRLVGALSFFERREVKDVIAYLRLVANPSDDVSFLRAVAVPRRGTGAGTLEKLSTAARETDVSLLQAAADPQLTGSLRPATRSALTSFAQLINRLSEMARQSSVAELIDEIVRSIKYESYLADEEGAERAADRMDNVRELASAAEALTQDITEEVVGTKLDVFLQRAALVAQIDALDPNADAVALMTVHNAKGLEFPVVFISGLEDGLFPLSRSADDPDLMAEERRLLYVGVTRAEKKLYLSYAATRRRNGVLTQAAISSFLRYLPRTLWTEKPTMRFRSDARAPQAAPPPMYSTARRATYGVPVRKQRPAEEDISQETMWLAAGSRVRHQTFGPGTIADISGVGPDAKVTIDFDDETIGRKRLVVAYAGLQSGWDE